METIKAITIAEEETADKETVYKELKKYGDYRKMLKMKIFSRCCNNSLYEIEEYLNDNFEGVSVSEQFEPANQIVYTTSSDRDFKLFSIMRDKSILPCVAGVECVVDIV